eukprot:287557_1
MPMYKWTIFAVAACIVMMVCGCVVKMYCKKNCKKARPYLEHVKSHSMMQRAARYSKSCDEGRQTPPSSVDDEMDLMNDVHEEILEMQEMQGTAGEYGENDMLAEDEYVIDGESTVSAVEIHDGEHEQDINAINGEYDEEGNVLEEDVDEEQQTNIDCEHDTTNDGDNSNIGKDEFIVMSDNDSVG